MNVDEGMYVVICKGMADYRIWGSTITIENSLFESFFLLLPFPPSFLRVLLISAGWYEDGAETEEGPYGAPPGA